MNTEVSARVWSELARELDVEEAAVKAVAEVESAGSGFLPGPPPRPRILFEGHAFHRLTGGRFDAQAPNLSYPNWNKAKYSGSADGEWQRLEAACALDRAAARQSASWGMFEIMGFNYAYCGCPRTSRRSSRCSTRGRTGSSGASRASSRDRRFSTRDTNACTGFALAETGVLKELKAGRESLFVHPKYRELLTGDENVWVYYAGVETDTALDVGA